MPNDAAASRSPATDRSGERGLSLVELVIATVLMVVGLVGIMNSSVQLHALQRLDAEVAMAYRACLKSLEDLRTLPMASLMAMNGSGFVIPGPDPTKPALAAQAGDTDGLPGAITVRLEASNPRRVIYRITATAKWHGASGNSSVELMTLWGGVP